MEPALHQLGVGSTGPDRLADTSEPVGGAVRIDELLPRGDDASRVAPDLAHVREGDPVGIGTQPGLQQLDPVGVDEDEGGFVGGQAFAEEGKGRRDELVIAGVEERLVTKPRVRANRTFCHAQHITERTPPRAR